MKRNLKRIMLESDSESESGPIDSPKKQPSVEESSAKIDDNKSDGNNKTPAKVWPIFSSMVKKQCITPNTKSPMQNVSFNANNCDANPDLSKSFRSPQTSAPKPERFNTPSSAVKPAAPKTPKLSQPTPTKAPPVDKSEDVVFPHLSYDFLYPVENRRDIDMRKYGDPEYDERTLYVPERFLNSQTPALRQWWLIKQRNMDAILFFKMGKFYEFFNEDAVIAVSKLDLIYMKGDDKPAHAGFPEVSFNKYAKTLIEMGYKVLRIEQTETPAMMEDRCQRTGKKGKFDKVVAREICRVTTKGTQMMGVMESVFHSSQNQYLMAICESLGDNDSDSKATSYGVCFVDVTIGRVHIGQFEDDNNQSKLNILLAHNKPTEVLYERSNLSRQAHQAFLRTGALMTSLKQTREFWPIKRALTYLKANDIFENEQGAFEYPQVLRDMFEAGDGSESLMVLEPMPEFTLALRSFGAMVFYLQSALIADQVLKCASFEVYKSPLNAETSQRDIGEPCASTMILDHVALKNLEILENSCGTTESTLYDSINHCKTHFGQRLLRQWICSPLCDIEQINNRLDAVEALVSNDNASIMNEIVHVLSKTPDLERLLSKIKSQCFKSSNEARAIMFDGNHHSKAKITSFLNLLQSLERLLKFVESLSTQVQHCGSDTLKRLMSLESDGGLYPNYYEILDYFKSAFNHEAARTSGQIIPAKGVDAKYDKCQQDIDDINDKLNDYLDEQKTKLGCRNLEYFGSGKNRFQIQVPEVYCKRVPSEYTIETTRKGFKRYYTPTIEKLFSKLTVYEEEMKKILEDSMSVIFAKFAKHMRTWTVAIECIAVLDVLQSIASYVRSLKANGVDLCRPEFIRSGEGRRPLIQYVGGKHPALVKTLPNYVANDLQLDDKLLLLSGANMGGKSTLMRQTALMVLLAQIGCFVPAKSLKLTPVDRVFSRLGASDRLLDGESTFYTELVETSAMLRCATSSSLLLLDELGRGTSTYDGTAIAYAVIQEIRDKIRCRCIFSTHYHSLVADFEHCDSVRLAHMACKIERNNSNDELDHDPLQEDITFLYKIADGPTVRSFGFNVAKLAGICNDIIHDAYRKAKEMELCSKSLDALQRTCKEGASVKSHDELKTSVLKALESK